MKRLTEQDESSAINVEYMYALATANDNATIVIKTTDLQKSAAVLENAGIPLVKVTDIEG